MKPRITFTRLMALAMVLAIGGSLAWSHLGATATPAKPDTMYRVESISSNGSTYSVPLIKQGTYTMPGTTPVTSAAVCVPGDPSLFVAQFTLGAAPTFAAAAQVTNVLQNSFDGGATWSNVGTSFAAVNATLTPAGGQETGKFSDVRAATTIAFGNCWRVKTTWAGSAGTTTANYGVYLVAK